MAPALGILAQSYHFPMRPPDRKLLLAGLAAVLSLVLATAALTIAIIAASRPPASAQWSAARSAAEASRIAWLCAAAGFNFCLPLWLLAQVVLRRCIPARIARGFVTANISIGLSSALTLIVLLVSLRGVYWALLAIEGVTPITDSTAFSGLTMSLGVMSVSIAMLGYTLFDGWTNSVRHSVAQPSFDPVSSNV